MLNVLLGCLILNPCYKQLMNKLLIVPDVHIPFEDPIAWKLMLASCGKVDGVVLLGDTIDAYDASTHEKDVTKRVGLAYELTRARARLTELEGLLAKPNKKSKLKYSSDDPECKNFAPRLYWISGNHENRIERAMGRDNVTGLLSSYLSAGLLSKRTVLEAVGLSAAKWTWVGYGNTLYVGNQHEKRLLALTHDLGPAGATAHVDALRTTGTNVIIGHTHRAGSTVLGVGGVGGKSIQGTMLGWLGNADEARYASRTRTAREWSLGYGLAYVPDTGAQAYVVHVPIKRSGEVYSCVVDGKEHRTR